MNTSVTLVRCCDCKEHKPATEFYAKSGRPGKLITICKPCMAARCRAHRARRMIERGFSVSKSHRARRPLNFAASLLSGAEKRLARGDLAGATKYLVDATAAFDRYIHRTLSHG